MNIRNAFLSLGTVAALTATNPFLDLFEKAKAQEFNATTNTFTIRNDLGGLITSYELIARTLQDRKAKVIIDGDCYSACTLLLRKRYDLNICTTYRGRLFFHMPFETTLSIYEIQNMETPIDSSNIVSNEEAIENSKKAWQENWLNQFNSDLNTYLEIATEADLIPNPSKTRNVDKYFELSALYAFPLC